MVAAGSVRYVPALGRVRNPGARRVGDVERADPRWRVCKAGGPVPSRALRPECLGRAGQRGGMKYMVLTARHHDGFALFDDTRSNFTSVKSAAHRDIVADYVKAVRAAGLGVGLYYSPLDWRFPGYFFPGIYREDADEMRAQFQRQLDELGSHYGKIDILWFDGGGNEWLGFGGIEFDHGKWRSRPADKPYSGVFDWHDDETLAHLRKLQPDIIVNDRTDAPADFRIRESYGEL